MYDGEKRRAVAVERGKRGRDVYKGAWEHLLCEECEAKLSKSESYFKRAWFDQGGLPSRPKPGRIEIKGLDYGLFRLFHLSILWKMAISSREWFSMATLSERHAGRLREMLYEQDAHLYPYYAFIARCLTHDGVPFQAISNADTSIYSGVIPVITCLYAGCAWSFFVCSYVPPAIESEIVTQDGTFPLQVETVDSYFQLSSKKPYKK